VQGLCPAILSPTYVLMYLEQALVSTMARRVKGVQTDQLEAPGDAG